MIRHNSAWARTIRTFILSESFIVWFCNSGEAHVHVAGSLLRWIGFAMDMGPYTTGAMMMHSSVRLPHERRSEPGAWTQG